MQIAITVEGLVRMGGAEIRRDMKTMIVITFVMVTKKYYEIKQLEFGN